MTAESMSDLDLDLAAEVCSRNGWTLVKQPIECGKARIWNLIQV